MFLYQNILIAVASLIALYALSIVSAPLYPHDLLSYFILGASSIYLFIRGIILNKQKKRVSSMFVLGSSLIAIVFLFEYQYILANNQGIDPAVFKQNLNHAIVVYNAFRFFFLAMCAAVFIKELYEAIRDFA